MRIEILNQGRPWPRDWGRPGRADRFETRRPPWGRTTSRTQPGQRRLRGGEDGRANSQPAPLRRRSSV